MSNYNIAIGIIIVMLLVMLLVLFCVILIRLHINKITKYQNDIHQKEIDIQKILTQSIIENQDEVRNQIATDLHDDVGQQITVLNLGIENLKLDHPEIQSSLDHLTDSLFQMSQSVRMVSHRLHSSFSEKDSLQIRIEKDLEHIKKSRKLNIVFQFMESEISNLSNSYSQIIFRMYQEIINNILKHSKASQVEIELIYQPKFVLKITDNGTGFTFSSIKKGLGLINLKKRAEIINFDFIIESEPQKGTTIQIKEKQN